jgi:hypothetical protein
MPFADNLILLGEYEFGFSTTRIGFPSISACRAILYQSSSGLFGFHQATGYAPNKIDRDAAKFADFVSHHGAGPGRGLKLYVGAKIGEGSTYAMGMPGLQEFTAEIRAIKDALHFQGPVLAYDLSHNRRGNQGVYVEFVRRGEACDVFINDWVDHHNPAHKGPPIGNPGDHMHSRPGAPGFTVPNSVYLQADITGQQQVEPIVMPGV